VVEILAIVLSPILSIIGLLIYKHLIFNIFMKDKYVYKKT